MSGLVVVMVSIVLFCDSGATASEEGARRRRRQSRALSDRVSAMRKRAHDTDQWRALRGTIIKRLSILSAVIVAGALIYNYVKH